MKNRERILRFEGRNQGSFFLLRTLLLAALIGIHAATAVAAEASQSVKYEAPAGALAATLHVLGKQ